MNKLKVIVDELGRCDWSDLRKHADRAREVVRAFSRWNRDATATSILTRFREACPMAWEEAIQVSQIIGLDPTDVLAANVTYDVAKTPYACTAFALDNNTGPFHAHSLDWEIEADILRRNAIQCTYVDHCGNVRLVSMSWPGFLGVFVGMAPRNISVTLNAVWSEDQAVSSEPIGFFLRKILLVAPQFDEAISLLKSVPLACDCLLLVTGSRAGELAVVERTPTRSAVRCATSQILVVTNHYHNLAAGSHKPGYVVTGQEPFGEGSEERCFQATKCLQHCTPQTLDRCFDILAQPPFRQKHSIQRVAMKAASGSLLAESFIHNSEIV